LLIFRLQIKTENNYAKDYEGKIYVADFFYHLHLYLSQNDQQFSYSKSNNNPKVILSHTVFPEVDNVAALKAYAIEKE
jgi:protein SCO1/2